MSRWSSLWKQFLDPEVDPARLEQSLERVKSDLPRPVFWLLGKTQSGKTSVVRALTGASDAEIGNGFQPCTRTARLYDFPSVDDCVLRFLDTRGLGEVDYSPEEDLQRFSREAHLLVVTMRAMDMAQEPVVQAVRTVLAKQSDWPVLVLQTAVHDGYPNLTMPHAVPWPFAIATRPGDPVAAPGREADVPPDLARAIAHQRTWFEGVSAPMRFVPVDFTLPEDGWSPVDYGLDAVWSAIEQLFPFGLKSLLARSEFAGDLAATHRRTAQAHVLGYAIAAGGAAAIPVPWVDLPLVFAIQSKMFHAVANIYHQPMNGERMGEVLALLGMGGLSRLLAMGGRELMKGIPAVGSAAVGIYNGAVTYALGMALVAYFERVKQGAVPDPAEFRDLYNRELAAGRDRLTEYLEKLRPWRKSDSTGGGT
jgi:uncharacterized protein (DUF697 family)